MLKRGSLIIYDDTGRVFLDTGDAMGDISDHILPVGLPYILTQYGELDNRIVKSVDLADPNHPKLVTETITKRPTYEELETMILEKEGVL